MGSLIACSLVLLVASPTHWGHFLTVPNRHDAVLDRFVGSIPKDASVGTHDELYAHLGFLRGAQIGLDPLPRFALFDFTYHSTAWDERVRPRFERLLTAGVYRIVRTEDNVVLAERMHE